MTRAALLLALLVAAGCKSDDATTGSPADARDLASDVSHVSAEAPPDRPADVAGESAPETCEAIIAEYTRVVAAADRSCTADSDCLIEGDANLRCEPGVLSIMCGVAVNDRAFPAAAAATLRSAASRLGCRSGNYDCGEWRAVCTQGRCAANSIRGCLGGAEPARDGG